MMKSSKTILMMTLAVVIITGMAFMRYTWLTSMDHTLTMALKIAQSAEAALPEDAVSSLSANSQDTAQTGFQEIKHSLSEMVRINSGIRFAYIYVQKSDRLYFAADSEPVSSPDYSPPGQEYAEADPVYYQPFVDGQVTITPPATDRWGRWVSVLVPIFDPVSGRTEAVLAMDYPAAQWYNAAIFQTAQAGVVVVLFILLVLAIFWIAAKNQILIAERNKLNQASEEISKSAERYKLLFTEMSSAFVHYQIIRDAQCHPVDYRYISVNPAFLTMMGMPEDSLIGSTVKTVNPQTKSDWMDHFKTVASTGQSVQFESFSPFLNRYFEVKVYRPSADELAAFYTDITERLQTELALRQEKNLLEAIFNSVQGIIYLYDDQGRLVRWNKKHEEVTGYTAAELAGKRLLDWYPGDEKSQQAVIAGIETTNREGFGDAEADLQRRDGTKIPMYLTASSLMIDGHAYFTGIGVDISERKQAEVELQQSEAKHRTMVANISDVIAIIDRTGRIKYKSPNIEKLFGWRPEELVGKEAWFTVHPDDLQRIQEEFTNLLSEDGKVETVEYRYLCRDGCYKEIELTAVNLTHDPNIKGVLTNYQDVTERNTREKEIIFLNYHDLLTGLYNRRFYEEEIARLDSPHNLPISIVMGDVNGLKLINDAFGHDHGDIFLQKAAISIQRACRSNDIIARWGGDEFIILLPKTNSEAAEEVINRIKNIYASEEVNAIKGSISFGCDTKIHPDEEMLKVLKNAEDNMYKNKSMESESIRGNTINTIVNTLNEKSPREEQHSKRVSEICQKLGKALGLSNAEISRLKAASLLHDIGKIAIDEEILNKTGLLSDGQWESIKKHPEIGYRILISSHAMIDLADCTLAHHEKWDGSGYPNGLKGEAIPRDARIIALADCFDAMTSKRSYQKVLSDEEALAEIINNAGSQFDPQMARVFVEKVLGEAWPPEAWPAKAIAAQI